MKKIIDVVNLNADASCLSTKWWLKMLSGGTSSYLYQWLNIYVKLGKKISLGVTGATVSDIVGFNKESVNLINANRDVFEIIIRPYSHDIALLRSTLGFKKNLETGIQILEKEFETISSYFLPPEFMLTNEQVKILADLGVKGTFINGGRFKKEIKERIPEDPYMVKGLFDSQLRCIPFESSLTQGYLHSIHHFTAEKWNSLILNHSKVFSYCWRDGESSFFLPGGNEREEIWLKNESKDIERIFIKDVETDEHYILNSNLKDSHYHYYPIHSFLAWMKESRMLSYIMQIVEKEKQLPDFDKIQTAVWLQIINSDILSAIEKDSPVITIRESESNPQEIFHTIWRSERGIEGEEWLNLLSYWKSENILDLPVEAINHRNKKLVNRIKYLQQIISNNAD